MIFVFGSNLKGFHGAGAARTAVDIYAAEMGVAVGPQGEAYAIPTKDKKLQPLPIMKIYEYVKEFTRYANENPTKLFKVTAIGTGFAGFTHHQMAPLFANCGDNCYFDEAWKPILGERKRYWGTYDTYDNG